MFYEFELGYNTAEANKDIYCAKNEGTVSKWLKKFL